MQELGCPRQLSAGLGVGAILQLGLGRRGFVMLSRVCAPDTVGVITCCNIFPSVEMFAHQLNLLTFLLLYSLGSCRAPSGFDLLLDLNFCFDDSLVCA